MSLPSRDVDALLALKDARELAGTLVNALDARAITSLCETAQNVIIGNIPSSPRQLSRLRQYKKELLLITRDSTSDNAVVRTFKKPGLAQILLEVAEPTLREWSSRA